MPFGPYKDFQDCVLHNRDKRNPEAYCGTIQRAIEGKQYLTEQDWQGFNPRDRMFFHYFPVEAKPKVQIVEDGKDKTGELNGSNKAREVGGFESPEPGDLPDKGAEILAHAYAECRKDGGDKEKCSKIAWGAVHRAGFKGGPTESKSYTFYTNGLGHEEVPTLKGKQPRYFVTGYISTPDIDLVNDLVTPEALDEMLNQLQSGSVPIKLDVEHESVDLNSGAMKNTIPAGRIVEARKDNKGLWVRGELNAGVERFGDVWNSVKSGFLDAFSITFRVKDRAYRMINGIKTRIINSLDLLNVALTGTPVNPQATITEVFAKAVKEDKSASIERILASARQMAETGKTEDQIYSELMNSWHKELHDAGYQDTEIEQAFRSMAKESSQIFSGSAKSETFRGDKVIIAHGPLKGKEGTVTEARDWADTVSIMFDDGSEGTAHLSEIQQKGSAERHDGKQAYEDAISQGVKFKDEREADHYAHELATRSTPMTDKQIMDFVDGFLQAFNSDINKKASETSDVETQIRKLHKEGKTDAEIAQLLGITLARIEETTGYLQAESIKQKMRAKAATKDNRPPKAWWDACTSRAGSFADDPDKFCGALWANPSAFGGGREMRESFGKGGAEISDNVLKTACTAHKEMADLQRFREKATCHAKLKEKIHAPETEQKGGNVMEQKKMPGDEAPKGHEPGLVNEQAATTKVPAVNAQAAQGKPFINEAAGKKVSWKFEMDDGTTQEVEADDEDDAVKKAIAKGINPDKVKRVISPKSKKADDKDKDDDEEDEEMDEETKASIKALPELKSAVELLKTENESLKAELKAVKDMPIFKAGGPSNEPVKQTGEKNKTPLEMLR